MYHYLFLLLKVSIGNCHIQSLTRLSFSVWIITCSGTLSIGPKIVAASEGLDDYIIDEGLEDWIIDEGL